MARNTGISWTDHTFNIVWGCEKVSPGCKFCYADVASARFGFAGIWGKGTPRRTFGTKHWNEPLRWNKAAEKDGVRRRVFCASMGDVCEDHPTVAAEREKLWPLIRATPWLDWQLLTKRADRWAACLPPDWGDGYPNVWLGVSIETQRYAARAGELAKIPAVVRFISAEPLLGALDLRAYLAYLDWVIVGGESGPSCRPMDISWAASLKDQCDEAGVAFYLKQLGGHPDARAHDKSLLEGMVYMAMPAPRHVPTIHA